MLGRSVAERLAQIDFGVVKARAYFENGQNEVEATEQYVGEDTEKGAFIRKLSCKVNGNGYFYGVEFYDGNGNLVWRERVEQNISGEYTIEVDILYPYERE